MRKWLLSTHSDFHHIKDKQLEVEAEISLSSRKIKGHTHLSYWDTSILEWIKTFMVLLDMGAQFTTLPGYVKGKEDSANGVWARFTVGEGS